MSTLLESLPKEIARLEAKYGSDSRSAKLLRQHVASHIKWFCFI